MANHASIEEKQFSIINNKDLPKIGSIWKHYKGNRYVVQGLGILESNEDIVVIYSCEHKLLSYSVPWIRPLSEWNEEISESQKRFTLVS